MKPSGEETDGASAPGKADRASAPAASESAAASRRSPSAPDRRRRFAAALAVLSFLVYQANPRFVRTADTWPTELLPVAIVEEGSVYLDRYLPIIRYASHKVEATEDGHLIGTNPLLPGLLAVPLVWIYAQFASPIFMAAWLGKLTASLCAAASVALVYLALRERAGPRASLFASVAYGLGSGTWFYAMGLWQHAPSQLFVAGAMLCYLRAERDPRQLGPAGLLAALAVAARPTDVVLAVVLTADTAIRRPRAVWRLIVWALPVAVALFAANQAVFGSWLFGGYAREMGIHWRVAFWEGLAGLFLSPNVGLFWSSPVFLFAAFGLVRAVRGRPAVRAIALAFGAHALLFSFWWEWYGGFRFGPRMLTDLLPAAALVLGLAVDGERRLRRAAPWVALAVSCAIQAVAVSTVDFSWHVRYDHGPRSVALTLRPTQIAYYLRRGRIYGARVRRLPGADPKGRPMITVEDRPVDLW